jgi:hypothetical protein
LENNEYSNILPALAADDIEAILVGLGDVASIASKTGALGAPVGA